MCSKNHTEEELRMAQFSVLLLVAALFAFQLGNAVDDYIYIQLRDSDNLVLDAGQNIVKIQGGQGHDAQQWKFENGPDGTRYIYNRLNGDVLDLKIPSAEGETVINVITAHKNSTAKNQRWYLGPDGFITNFGKIGYAIQILGNISAGSTVGVVPKASTTSQWEYPSTRLI